MNKLYGKRVEEMVDDRRRDFEVCQEGNEICRNGARVSENKDVDMMCQMCTGMSAIRWWTEHRRSINCYGRDWSERVIRWCGWYVGNR